ncbi:MAG: hypothetical protein WC263_03785 [Candidatus Micrarchaeia archaeon]
MAYGIKLQDEKKQASLRMEAYTDGSVSLTFKGMPALLGDAKPYYGLSGSGLCSKNKDGAIQSIGGIHLGEKAKIAVNPDGAMRVDFEGGRQLILKPAGEFQGFAIVKPLGISMGPYTDNSLAGQLLIGDVGLEVIYTKQDKSRKALEGIASGKVKLVGMDAVKTSGGYRATLAAENGDKVILDIGPKKENGFREIKSIESVSSKF